MLNGYMLFLAAYILRSVYQSGRNHSSFFSINTAILGVKQSWSDFGFPRCHQGFLTEKRRRGGTCLTDSMANCPKVCFTSWQSFGLAEPSNNGCALAIFSIPQASDLSNVFLREQRFDSWYTQRQPSVLRRFLSAYIPGALKARSQFSNGSESSLS